MNEKLLDLNYVPYIDICVMTLSYIYARLLKASYSIRKENRRLFRMSNWSVSVSAALRVIYSMMLANIKPAYVSWLYGIHAAIYILLTLTLVYFCIYIANLVNLPKRWKHILMVFESLITAGLIVYEVTLFHTHWGYYIDDKLKVHEISWQNGFAYVYVTMTIILAMLIVRNRHKFVTFMYRCLVMILCICYALIIVEAAMMESSYTCLSFSIPILTVLFLFHHNSYDLDTGTMDEKAFLAYVADLKNRDFTIICFRLEGVKPERLAQFSNDFFHMSEKYFKESATFRLREDSLVLVYEKAKNLNAVFVMPVLLEDFYKLHEHFLMDYQIITVHSSPELKDGDAYINLITFLERRVKLNSTYECTHDDVVAYLDSNYIVSELHDIILKNDLDDERVLVYCQPVYNTQTRSFTTAEALMRLKLPNTGMVFPDVFIPLAEEYDYIHFLSMIILNKTCKKVRQLLDDGYILDRISVNFAMSELRGSKFCDEVKGIVESNDIPYDKIALELTESMNEAEFGHVQSVMSTLHSVGMKFYLDDFGTGYSNFERIMKLPIDIIKFDRSLTIVAVNDEGSRDMVVGFTDIFRRANYKILFEGVEDETDEKQCIEMHALYLQGYKYSRPIAIDELDSFFDKEDEVAENVTEGEAESKAAEDKETEDETESKAAEGEDKRLVAETETKVEEAVSC